eukprot:728761-Pyramimonas_sp.AAC.2
MARGGGVPPPPVRVRRADVARVRGKPQPLAPLLGALRRGGRGGHELHALPKVKGGAAGGLPQQHRRQQHQPRDHIAAGWSDVRQCLNR